MSRQVSKIGSENGHKKASEGQGRKGRGKEHSELVMPGCRAFTMGSVAKTCGAVFTTPTTMVEARVTIGPLTARIQLSCINKIYSSSLNND